MNSCTSSEEARKGLKELDSIMNLVLLRSSSAQAGEVAEKDEGMEDGSGMARVRDGMNDDREVEGRYWELLGKLRIVESDFQGEFRKNWVLSLFLKRVARADELEERRVCRLDDQGVFTFI